MVVQPEDNEKYGGLAGRRIMCAVLALYNIFKQSVLNDFNVKCKKKYYELNNLETIQPLL